MNIATLPRVAIDLGDGLPWYPFRTGMDGAILFTDKPELPAESFYWVTLHGDERPRAELNTETVAEILFCSAVTTGAELDAAELAAAINATLTVYRCHVELCAYRHESEAGDYPAETAARFDWCIRCISRALAVSV